MSRNSSFILHPLSCLLSLLLLLNTACAPSVEQAPPSLPPSATPNPFPGLGAETFNEPFSDPGAWRNARAESDGGNRILLTPGRLTLAVNVPPGSLVTLRPDLLVGDFYAEADLRINRCTAEDSYGLLFRAASEGDAYRFALNCLGQARAELVRGGTLTPLQDWAPSGDVPPGAPGQVTLAVWAAGSELRFYLNNRYQFSLFDRSLRNGVLGFFAKSASPAGLNIGITRLQVYSVSYASPTPTVTPSRTATPTRTRMP